ncbi:putative membrane protein [Mucilaginibacter oryzae]|uniref:Putative membrane protein n=1 Tax=Mucilaginibacter oryzae TaxID=468058 RepID=A0A316HFN6_9SPHI|nr:heparan-alpha-glucosaminide N-acetyltransferase domain-containing protein [Mucilaginibacter oryzae]PWK80024.1 putative membrane protein [Mucilaginibacter oryzae]
MPTTSLAPASNKRIDSIDILRGIIMLVMALDHVRDVFHQGSPDPTDLATTTPFLFFTRWITHFCAPNFLFLSGISAYLAGKRRTKKELSIFLIQRGIWLVLVEVLIINTAFELNFQFHFLVLQVMWAIGVSMILLGLIIWMPIELIGIIGLLIFCGHNLFDYFHTSGFMSKLLFNASGFGPQNIIRLDASHNVLDAYAVLPWTGVMLLGYFCGQCYQSTFDGKRRQHLLLRLSALLLFTFLLLRYFNLYGDPAPWSHQKTAVLSIISFLNVTKYPCSLHYLCMTLSAGLFLLAMAERFGNRLTRLFAMYGSVPFFYYILHFYLLRLFNIIIFFVSGFNTTDIQPKPTDFSFHPANFGFSLWGVYLVWLAVICTLYLPCRWFSAYKKKHRAWWLSYL